MELVDIDFVHYPRIPRNIKLPSPWKLVRVMSLLSVTIYEEEGGSGVCTRLHMEMNNKCVNLMTASLRTTVVHVTLQSRPRYSSATPPSEKPLK